MTGIDRRGEYVGLAGMVLSGALAVVLGILAVWSESSSVWAGAFLLFGTAGIWLLTLIHLHQQRLVREEQLEVAELERMRHEKLGGAQTIFEEEDLDQMEKLSMARRLRSIERFLIPMIALMTAFYHLAAGLLIVQASWFWKFQPIIDAADGPLLHAKVLLFFTGGIAFVCFMMSRYALGMSRLEDWGILRAGGDFLFGASAVSLLISIALLCSISGLAWVEVGLGYAIGVLMMILACETLINFVLDFYRPRVHGLAQRPFYDSRLLGIFSEPVGILRSLADAADYQFGFRVSETWFYKLLGRAVLPLVLIQIVVILALTCIVVVPPGHVGVIEHAGFSRSSVYTAEPGIHLTWFWPLDRVTIIPVERIQRMELGHDMKAEEEEDRERRRQRLAGPILWTRKHYKKEYKLLVADRTASKNTKVPVNLLSVSMPLQWRVKGEPEQVKRYHLQSQDAAAMIESLAYRELTSYAARADVLDLLGEKGIKTGAILKDLIQKACDGAGYDGQGLGVEIVYVGIGGIHPPPDEDVAKTYEEVVGAFETRDATIKAAQGDAVMDRIGSAGEHWEALFEAIVREDEARENESSDLDERRGEVERLLTGERIGGDARAIAAQAERDTIQRVFEEMSKAERYELQLTAYDAAPDVYRLRVYLRTIEEGLRDLRKYVIALDDPSRVICEYDLKPSQEFNAISTELGAMEARQE